MTDECTMSKLRVSYARVLIEVDTTQAKRGSIPIKEPGGKRWNQEVRYKWSPVFYQECQIIGHNCKMNKRNDPMPRNKVWKVKHEQKDTDGGDGTSRVVVSIAKGESRGRR